MREKPRNGETFGQLTIIDCDSGYFVSKSGHRAARVLVRCSCGNEKYVRLNSLRMGDTVSCGCKKNRLRHGMKGTRIYSIWQGMRDRCSRKNNHSYKHYGGRGIKVCQEWELFEGFHEWALGNGYSPDLSIDRIDNAGNYCPENCRWSDTITQANNKRLRTDNLTGIKGVSLHSDGKYQAVFNYNRKRYYVGLFDTIKEAGEAIKKHREAHRT